MYMTGQTLALPGCTLFFFFFLNHTLTPRLGDMQDPTIAISIYIYVQ
jgi:hypothetical protein